MRPWRDRLIDAALFPVCLTLVAGYVAWRFFTCCVDGWDDIRHGRVPPIFRGEDVVTHGE